MVLHMCTQGMWHPRVWYDFCYPFQGHPSRGTPPTCPLCPRTLICIVCINGLGGSTASSWNWPMRNPGKKAKDRRTVSWGHLFSQLLLCKVSRGCLSPRNESQSPCQGLLRGSAQQPVLHSQVLHFPRVSCSLRNLLLANVSLASIACQDADCDWLC